VRGLRNHPVVEPREAPRHLGHVDSWHAVLIGLGGEAEHLIRRLTAGLAHADLIYVRRETYGYRTPNGYEERERVAISHRQAHVHIHIHHLGQDLFVGWQALLNWAQWAETLPVATLEAGRHSMAFRDIRPTWYYPSEFDLIDLNSLSETVHRRLGHEIKGLLREHGRDQEVDFEFIRSDRENALDRRKAWPERPQERKRNSNLIFGWGAVRRAGAGEMQLTPIDAQDPPRGHGLAAIPPNRG
jgi:hypothetical protein